MPFHSFSRFLTALFMVASGLAPSVPSKAAPLDRIEVGIVLTTQKEDHCFVLGNLGLSEEKSKDYLSGLGHELAFSKDLNPDWPDWGFAKVRSVYCQAGIEGASRLAGMMVDPASVRVCSTLQNLIDSCNCVLLVNTGEEGEDNFEIVSACLEARRPIFVDKFLAPDLSEARILLKKAQELGVPLLSSSYIWTSQPGLELKERLGQKRIESATSTGYSSGKITGAIHSIAQLQLLSGQNRPVSVKSTKDPKTKETRATVIFENGLVGELIPRREGTIFELTAVAEGERLAAEPYEGKHSRPSPIILYNRFFDLVRGRGEGQPSHLMLDAIAIWEAAERSLQTGGTVRIEDIWSQSTQDIVEVGELLIHPPTIAHPYYHFSLDLETKEPSRVAIHHLKSAGKVLRDFDIEEREARPDPNFPHLKKRLAIHEAIITPRPEKTYQHPVLVGRMDWRVGQSSTVKIEFSLGAKRDPRFYATAKAETPSTGGYWNPDWAFYQSVVLTESIGERRTSEPVQVTFLCYPDQIADPEKEIRVVQYDTRNGQHTPVPSQLMDYHTVNRVEPPMYNQQGELKPSTFLPTSSATLAFPAVVEPNSSSLYLIFYGNPKAESQSYPSDLQVSGTPPGVTVENRHAIYKLHDLSGMLDELSLKARPEYTFVHKKETNGAIQWNPGCYSPPRAWAHLSDWDLEDNSYDHAQTGGPMVFRTRRWGFMPLMPELECSMEYEYYAQVPYFRMRSAVRVKYDTPVQAIRNGEVVFSRESFSEAAWWDPISGKVETRRIVDEPDLTEWVVPADTPWLAFFDREKGCGYAGIQIHSANHGLHGHLRTYNPYIYLTVGPWIYWVRALGYPYGGRNPQQLIDIPAGSAFLEEWAYLPFEWSKDEPIFTEVERWQRVLTHPVYVHLLDFTDDRMQIPEEIYIEPETTGWEK